jgi:hypothetical protein
MQDIRRRYNVRKLLYVKAGEHENAVTKAQDLSEDDARVLIQKHGVKFLGSDTLPILGERHRLPDVVGPDYVVVQLPADDEHASKFNGPGYYVILGLDPEDVRKYIR